LSFQQAPKIWVKRAKRQKLAQLFENLIYLWMHTVQA